MSFHANKVNFVVKSNYESEMNKMRYFTSLFWILIYGQILGYMGAALTSTQYQPMTALIISIVFTILFWILTAALDSPSKAKKE